MSCFCVRLVVLVPPCETVLGPCMVAGVGMHNAAIFCMQVRRSHNSTRYPC